MMSLRPARRSAPIRRLRNPAMTRGPEARVDLPHDYGGARNACTGPQRRPLAQEQPHHRYAGDHPGRRAHRFRGSLPRLSPSLPLPVSARPLLRLPTLKGLLCPGLDSLRLWTSERTRTGCWTN